LGERDVRNVEVRGSIPLCSTILTRRNAPFLRVFCFAWKMFGRRSCTHDTRHAVAAPLDHAGASVLNLPLASHGSAGRGTARAALSLLMPTRFRMNNDQEEAGAAEMAIV
jgi:hypothetical protein